jgi:hypothetical protein
MGTTAADEKGSCHPMDECRSDDADLRGMGGRVAALSLIVVAAVALATACGSPEAASSARVEKVLANVRGIT